MFDNFLLDGFGRGGVDENAILGCKRPVMAVLWQFLNHFAALMVKGEEPYPLALQAYLETHESPLWHTPPRPFLEPAIEKHRDEITEDMGEALKKALEGDQEGSNRALERAGNYAASQVKNYFREDNGWPELSEKTIKTRSKKRKNVDNVRPLIDTGAMRQAVTYIVKGKIK